LDANSGLRIKDFKIFLKGIRINKKEFICGLGPVSVSGIEN
jgi:hypothetical protein